MPTEANPEYNISESVAYLAAHGRVITPERLRQYCRFKGTTKRLIAARHTNPAKPSRGEWLIRRSELDKLIASGNKRGNPQGFNQAARAARWSKTDGASE